MVNQKYLLESFVDLEKLMKICVSHSLHYDKYYYTFLYVRKRSHHRSFILTVSRQNVLTLMYFSGFCTDRSCFSFLCLLVSEGENGHLVKVMINSHSIN